MPTICLRRGSRRPLHGQSPRSLPLNAPLALVIFLFCFVSFAHAGSLTEKVQQTYQKTDQFQADFIQKTHVALLDRDIEEKGTLVFEKPGKFMIHYEGSRERKYISDGRSLWIYHPQDKEVEVIDHLHDFISQEALVFLGGLGDMTQEFEVVEKPFLQLQLKPKRKSSPFKQLILKIDPQSSLVKEVTLSPKGGNVSHYFFSAVRTNPAMPESTFQFHEKGIKIFHP